MGRLAQSERHRSKCNQSRQAQDDDGEHEDVDDEEEEEEQIGRNLLVPPKLIEIKFLMGKLLPLDPILTVVLLQADFFYRLCQLYRRALFAVSLYPGELGLEVNEVSLSVRDRISSSH